MFAHINDIDMYYEVSGSGEPVILIHGNSETHDIFDVLIKDLSETHQVYAIDSRCHGQSTRTREISYDLMASDVIAFIHELKLQRPTIYGFSDGGIIGLLVAMREPELLGRLITSGANLNPHGLKFWTRAGMWFVSVTGDKLFRMMLHEPDIKPEDLKKIRIPVVVLAGEKDVVKNRHTLLIASSIPDSTLEILPGESHGSYIVHSPKLYGILSRYL